MEKPGNACGRERIAGKINQAVVLYSIVCLMYQTAVVLMPVSDFFKRDGLRLFSPALAVIGLMLMGADFFFSRRKYAIRHEAWLWVFLGITLLSSLVRHAYGFGDSVKTIIWTMVQCFLIATFPGRLSGEDRRRVFRFLHTWTSLLFFPALLYMIARFFTMEHSFTESGMAQGWYEGRLFGIMHTLYEGTMLVALLTIATLARLLKCRSTLWKVLLGLESGICVIYLCLSDTRTVYVGLLASAFVLVFFRCRNACVREGKKKYARWILTGTAVFMAGVAVFIGVRFAVREGGLALAYEISRKNTAPVDTKVEEKTEDAGFESFVREAERPEGASVSSRRISVWTDYLQILTDRPSHMLIGLSPGGMDPYLYERYSDHFVVDFMKTAYPYEYQKQQAYMTHNAYLHVLVTTGIFGLAALMIFLVRFLASAMKNLVRGRGGNLETAAFLMVVLLLTGILFESDVFLRATSGSMIFWTAMGCLSRAVTENRGEACPE